MSLIWPLERLFESPVKIEQRYREKVADLEGIKQREGDPPTYRCRLCGLKAPAATFCLDCLADTMEPMRGR